jgi:hypothetical protein
MNMTFIEMLAVLRAGEPVRRNDWTPPGRKFIRLLELPNSSGPLARPVVFFNNRKDVTEYRFSSDDIAHDKWKTVT